MKLMTKRATSDGLEEGEGPVYVCIAPSQEVASRLVRDHIGTDSPYTKIETEQVVPDVSFDGPARVLGLEGSSWSWGR